MTSLRALFPTSAGRALTRRDVLLASLAVTAATIVSLLRVSGTGALETIWQEDGNSLLTLALYRTNAKTLLDPMNGYYVVVARAIGVLAAMLPVSWAAAVMSITAALLLGLMALLVYVASGSHLDSRLARFLVTVPLLIAPIAENSKTEIYNRPVCLHLFALYALFWIILWVPTKRVSKIVAVTVAGAAAASTLVTIVFIPLVLLRLWVRRDRTGIGILAMLVLGAAANALHILINGEQRGGMMYPEPLIALWDYVIWAVPSSMLGYRATSGLSTFHFPTWTADTSAAMSANLGVVLLGWAAVGLVVAVAATRRFSKPAWLLAAVAIAHSIALLCFTVMAQGNEPRYLLPVELLLFAALTVLLLPIVGRPPVALAAFAVFMAVVSAFNFRWDDTYRANSPKWTEQVRKATAECVQRPELQDVHIRTAPDPWGSLIYVPCHRLREVRPWDCPEERCAWFPDPANPAGRQPEPAAR